MLEYIYIYMNLQMHAFLCVYPTCGVSGAPQAECQGKAARGRPSPFRLADGQRGAEPSDRGGRGGGRGGGIKFRHVLGVFFLFFIWLLSVFSSIFLHVLLLCLIFLSFLLCLLSFGLCCFTFVVLSFLLFFFFFCCCPVFFVGVLIRFLPIPPLIVLVLVLFLSSSYHQFYCCHSIILRPFLFHPSSCLIPSYSSDYASSFFVFWFFCFLFVSFVMDNS